MESKVPFTYTTKYLPVQLYNLELLVGHDMIPQPFFLPSF
jgi:hypothetical protein